MFGRLHSLHTELLGLLLVQVVVQHGDLGGGEAGDTLGGGEEVSGGDDDGRAPQACFLVSEGDQPGGRTGQAGPEMSSLRLALPHLPTTNYQPSIEHPALSTNTGSTVFPPVDLTQQEGPQY